MDSSLPNASLSTNSTLLVVHDRIAALKLFLGFSCFSVEKLRQHLLSFSCTIWISKHVQVECTLSTKEGMWLVHAIKATWDFAITVCCLNAKYCLFVCLFDFFYKNFNFRRKTEPCELITLMSAFHVISKTAAKNVHWSLRSQETPSLCSKSCLIQGS